MSEFINKAMGDGFGVATGEELANLNKALATGSPGRGGSPAGTGSPMRPESLDATLKALTFKLENIKAWRTLAKKRAYNVVEEWNELSSYGANTSPFMAEGGLARAEDAYYERRYSLVKYLGTLREITHAMLMTRGAHGDQLTREIMNGTTFLLGQLEPKIFTASSAINAREFDGIEKQIVDRGTASNIIDLRGGPLTEEAIELGSQTVSDNYGQMQIVFGGTRAFSDLAKSMYPKERVNLPAPVDGVIGIPVSYFASQNGLVRLEPDTFLRPGGAPLTSALTGAPAAPATVTTAAASATSLWTATSAVYYSVSSVSVDGAESLPRLVSAPVAVSGNTQYVNITITRAVTPTAAYSYRIYRGTSADTSTHRFLKEVADATPGETGSATQVVTDYNYDLPGTSKAYGLYIDSDQGMAIKQLAPLMKLDLATTTASLRFMIMMYLSVEVYSPARNIVYKNVGVLS